MKLKDWDDEEEKAVKPEKGRGGKEKQDFGDSDSEDMDFGKPDTGAGQGLRRRSGGSEEGRGRSDRNQEDSDTEELAPLPGWAKALIFTGLAVLAAIICAALWHFVHPDKPEEGNQGMMADAQESSGEGQNPDSAAKTERGSRAGASSEAAAEPTAEPAGSPASKAPRESEKEPDAENQTASGPNAGQTEPSGTQSPQTPEAPEASGTPEAPEAPQVPQAPQVPGQSETPESQPSSTAQPQGERQEPHAGNTNMTFVSVQESVTPKDAVNLRTAPDTTDDGNIAVKIQNGEALARIGINNDTGWSRIDYNGQTLYAVSQYLTTDLNYKPPVVPADPDRVITAGGSVIIFENCDDWITPKEYVNLRTEPSTVQEDATVSCQLNYGEKAHRTGYSADFGWSRVEYNGQVLYVVTSFVNVIPAE
ncbi:MAG: hypothetical protein HFH95_08910 [Lachnospiraceae bacterium]|nr:hypothetical protein [uncultured Acetatifactor sp.]MCI8543420.1 hypothetical protein [Lachnospiraceae bacterium]